jgi:hypothetical protein
VGLSYLHALSTLSSVEPLTSTVNSGFVHVFIIYCLTWRISCDSSYNELFIVGYGSEVAPATRAIWSLMVSTKKALVGLMVSFLSLYVIQAFHLCKNALMLSFSGESTYLYT